MDEGFRAAGSYMALFAMCAIRRTNRSRTHREMRHVCATRGHHADHLLTDVRKSCTLIVRKGGKFSPEGIATVELTAVYEKVPEGYIGWVEELPGANSQGETLAETHENLIEAIQMILKANHEMHGTPIPTEFTIREKVALTV